MKKALADFCAAFGYEVVYGTDHKIRVKRVKHLQFPSSKDERRKELEELLRSAGKWDEFASLNIRKLEAALQRGALTDELARRLGRFYEEEESVRLRVSKIRPEEK